MSSMYFTVLICFNFQQFLRGSSGQIFFLISQMRKLRFKEVKVILPRSFSEVMLEPETVPLASYFLSCDSLFAGSTDCKNVLYQASHSP